MSPAEEKEILSQAQRIKRLGIEPVWLLRREADAEEAAKTWLAEAGADGEWTEEALARFIAERTSQPEALESPTVRLILNFARVWRKEKGTNSFLPHALDRWSDAIALKGGRGRPVRPGEELMNDRIRYGYYLRLKRAFTVKCGLPKPKQAGIDRLSLIEVATPPGDLDLEPALSRQVKAYQRDKGKPGVLMANQRVALALFELETRRPVSDKDERDARRLVRRVTKSLRGEAERRTRKSPI